MLNLFLIFLLSFIAFFGSLLLLSLILLYYFLLNISFIFFYFVILFFRLFLFICATNRYIFNFLIFFNFVLIFFRSIKSILFFVRLFLLEFCIFILSFLIFLLCLFGIIFGFICYLIRSFFFFVSSNLHPFNFTLMYRCINSVDFYLIFELWAAYPSSCSFFTLIIDIDSFKNFYFFLGVIRHCDYNIDLR